MKKFIITEAQGNSVLNYLLTKPYQEVFQLVAILTSMEEYKTNAEVITPKTEIVTEGEIVKEPKK